MTKQGYSAAYLIVLACLLGCDRDAALHPKTRPIGVPVNAIWAGGADGGAYMTCTVDTSRNVDTCIVWNDYTGGSSGPHDYRLLKDHRAAINSELRYTGAANDMIFLQHGLILQRL